MSGSSIDTAALAREMLDARSRGATIAIPPSTREGGLDLDAAYAVEAELARLRREGGHQAVGRKIGMANRAVWRALKLKTVIWGNMYDDTVQYAQGREAPVSIERLLAPKLEPEVVFKLKSVPASADPVAVLEATEWLALGFEIVDCPFPDWKFQPVDFISSFGLHAGLVIGEPRRVEPDEAASLVEQLASLTTRLSKNGELIEVGSGKNVLGNPAAAMGELAMAIPAQANVEPLRPGEVITTGSTTTPQRIASGERWEVVSEGGLLAPVAFRVL